VSNRGSNGNSWIAGSRRPSRSENRVRAPTRAESESGLSCDTPRGFLLFLTWRAAMGFFCTTRRQGAGVDRRRSRRPRLEILENRLQPGSVVVSLGGNLSIVDQATLGPAGVISEVLSTNHREMQAATSDPFGSVGRGAALETQPAGVPTKDGIEGLALTGA